MTTNSATTKQSSYIVAILVVERRAAKELAEQRGGGYLRLGNGLDVAQELQQAVGFGVLFAVLWHLFQ